MSKEPIEVTPETKQSVNEGRPLWHETFTPPNPVEIRPASAVKGLSRQIGRLISRLTTPIKDRMETDFDFIEKLPDRNSTPDQVREFEQRFTQGHDSTVE